MSTSVSPSTGQFSAELVRVRRNPVVLLGAATPGIAAVLALALVLAGVLTEDLEFPLILATILSVLATNYFYERNLRPWWSVVVVKTDDQFLHVGSQRFRRQRIQAALIVPGSSSGILLRVRFGLSIRLQATRSEARDLQAALGLDASQPVAFNGLSWVLASTRRTFLWLLVVNLSALATKEVVVRGVWIMPWVFSGLFALAFVPTRIQVSPGGVRIRWLGLGRDVEFEPVENVTWFTDERANAILGLIQGWGISGLRFVLRGGEELLVPFSLTTLKIDWTADSNASSLAVALAWQRIRDAARLRRDAIPAELRPEPASEPPDEFVEAHSARGTRERT